MNEFVTIYALLYGNDLALHTRLLRSLFAYTPLDQAVIRLWCNTIGKPSQKLVMGFKEKHGSADFEYLFSEENKPKYKAMRLMFHEMETWKPQTPWILWFDDDSYIDKSDWWQKTTGHIARVPNCSYVGQSWYVHHLPGQWDFIKQATWFKGKPTEMCATRTPGIKSPGITFAQGAYWWLRTDVMKQIDWPDVRLSHNGGDTLLGEAVRQQGLPFTAFNYGVAVNKAKRRGLSEKPAGSKVNTRR